MAYHHTASAAMPAQPQPQPNQNAVRTQRVNQVQFIEERQRHFAGSCGRDHCSPCTVGDTAHSTQFSCIHSSRCGRVQTYHDLSKWSMGWFDLTHPFLDDRSTAVRGPSVQTTVEQEATLRIPLANAPLPQPLNPAHLGIQLQPQIHPQLGTQPMYLPSAQPISPSSAQVAPSASAPAAHAPHMVLSATPRLEPEVGTSSPMSNQ